jgi:60 kDa SS-A/Ro ribonucleoprotein
VKVVPVVADPLALINRRVTSQSEQADPRQVPNNAGGYGFAINDLARLRRFLTMGTAGGTYYVGEQELTRENAKVVLDLVATDGLAVVNEILAISLAGRAPKQNPTIFALAAAAGLGNVETRRAALAVLPKVCRTGTHLFLFAKYIEQFRGWGPTLRRGVSSWYLSKPVEDLAYQLIKYRGREGWTHRDMLRLSHPTIGDPARASAMRGALSFAAGHEIEGETPRLIEGFLKAQSAASPAVTAALVAEYGLPWEALQPDHLTSAVVWGALLDRGLPQTALMRNLPRLTKLGLFQKADRRRQVAERLATGMSKARVHPVNVLVALRTYAGGRSVRGESTWAAQPEITDALDAGFYEAFGGVVPAGKRTLLGLDVSGSMGSPAGGLPISCREASAAIGMVTVATEPETTVVGFTSANRRGGWSNNAVLTPLDLSNRRRLDDVIRSISDLPFGGTDCALPWTEALAQGAEYDTIITMTDSETWAGTIHPHQAMRQYRDRMGIPTRSIVVGMTSSGFSINDPSDPLGLDVAGFDSAVPTLISDFSAGRV